MSPASYPTWQTYSRPETVAKMRVVAREVAERLRNEACVKSSSQLAVQQSQFPQLLQRPMSMPSGFPGLALLCSYLDACFPAEGWDTVGHRSLQAAIRDLEMHPEYRYLSLFGGLSGVAFAAWSLSQHGRRYQRLLATLDQQLLPLITTSVREVVEQQIHGCTDPVYDLITGPTGVGTYLLSRRENPDAEQALRTILTGLIYLAQEQEGIPHWYIPTHLAPKTLWSTDLGQGYVNVGLAHGIPGPLALLSLARSYDIEVADLDETITRVADWLIEHRMEDEWGINWPTICPLGASSDPPQTSRTGWCYGTPGVARALWLAGRAVRRTEYQEVAIAAMQAVYRQPLSVRRIDSPSFCHGVAGLLQVTLRFAHETGDPLFFEEAENLSQQLLELYRPEHLLGYRHEETTGVFVDTPWLLDGAAGVVLVLLAASNPCEPSWDRLFLLS